MNPNETNQSEKRFVSRLMKNGKKSSILGINPGSD